MNMINYRPLSTTKAFNQLFDNFFNQNLSNSIGADSLISHPSVNVVESDNNFRIELAAPGFEKENFELKVERGYLKLSASTSEKKEEVEEGKYKRREFNYVSFSRSFQLPESVDTENVVAIYEKGILVVTLPKKAEAQVEKSRLIEIK
ncbi:MAG: heat-shock protein [Saprospiraceae bacterium]|nr:MAG: heat-shock protein [Saprospiraceae bacterium]